MVTEDCAIAAPEAAKTAIAMSDFFIENFSKVKHGAPVRGLPNTFAFATPPETRANPLSGSWVYCTRMNLDPQRNAPQKRFFVAGKRQTRLLRGVKTTLMRWCLRTFKLQ
jgi:hypothetical protein